MDTLNQVIDETVQDIAVPPHNIEMEEGVIYSILTMSEALPYAYHILKPEDFYLYRHQLIYQSACELYKEDRPIDYLMISDQLERTGRLEQIGGLGVLTDSFTLPIRFPYYIDYVDKVAEYARRRETIKLSEQAVQLSLDSSNKFYNELTGIHCQLKAIQAKQIKSNDRLMTGSELSNYQLGLLEKELNEQEVKTLSFPWTGMQKLVPKINPGSLIGIAAAPGVGKTTFMSNCAEHWVKEGYNVAFFYLELDKREFSDRRMARMTGINKWKLAHLSRLNEDEIKLYTEGSMAIANWPINMVKSHGFTMQDIINEAQKLNEIKNLDMIVIDYFNKIRMVDRHGLNTAQNREADLEDLKVFLEDTGMVGMLAAQFDKSSRVSNEYLTLINAKETSALEDKSNVGITITRKLDTDSGELENQTDINIVKHNAGRTGKTRMIFRGDRYDFVPAQVIDLNKDNI